MSSEAIVQQDTRLALARMGALMYRNNVGACEDKTGRIIRYGLCNESAQLNRQLKSSDLVGVVPVLIQPHHVGRTLGVFAAIECKASGWHMTPSDSRAQAQERWINLIRSVGGVGGFVTDPAQLPSLLDTM